MICYLCSCICYVTHCYVTMCGDIYYCVIASREADQETEELRARLRRERVSPVAPSFFQLFDILCHSLLHTYEMVAVFVR